MRAIRLGILSVLALVVVVLDWILAFRPSRIRRTLAHIWRTDWREFSDAKRWLVDRGYSLTRDERYPMTSAVADLRKDGNSIEIESDRGIWTVFAGPAADDSRPHRLDAWAICLGTETPNFREAPSDMFWDLRLQLGYLRTHLSSIESACQPDRVQQTLQCLADARRAIDTRDIWRR